VCSQASNTVTWAGIVSMLVITRGLHLGESSIASACLLADLTNVSGRGPLDYRAGRTTFFQPITFSNILKHIPLQS